LLCTINNPSQDTLALFVTHNNYTIPKYNSKLSIVPKYSMNELVYFAQHTFKIIDFVLIYTLLITMPITVIIRIDALTNTVIGNY